jgi:transposase-like protein
MKKQRKQYAPEEKVAILRRHFLEKEPISKLCDEVGLQPTVFYACRRSSSTTGRLPSNRKHGRTIPPSRNGSHTRGASLLPPHAIRYSTQVQR